MRRILIVFLLLVVLLPSSSASGQVGHGIQYTPCIASNGTYQVGVRAIITGGASLELEHWFSTGGTVNDGFVSNGWTTRHTGIVEYSQLHYRYVGDQGVFAAAFVGTNYPACPEDPKVAEPIIPMWLLTKPDSYCILISEFHPSVESQKRLCFPGQEWVADHALCNGWVYDNGFWDCDIYGYGRLPYANLIQIFQRHLTMLKELRQ